MARRVALAIPERRDQPDLGVSTKTPHSNRRFSIGDPADVSPTWGPPTSARRGNGNTEPDPRRPSPTRWLRSIVASIAANLPVASREGLLWICQGGGGPNYRACSPSERIVPISWDGRTRIGATPSYWRQAAANRIHDSPQLRRPIDGNSYVPIVVVICVGSLQPLLRKNQAPGNGISIAGWWLSRVGGEPGSMRRGPREGLRVRVCEYPRTPRWLLLPQGATFVRARWKPLSVKARRLWKIHGRRRPAAHAVLCSYSPSLPMSPYLCEHRRGVRLPGDRSQAGRCRPERRIRPMVGLFVVVAQDS